MTTKIISLFFIMLLALVSLSLVSAQFSTSLSTLEFTKSTSSRTFTITNTNENVSTTFTMPSTLTLSNGQAITFLISPNVLTIANKSSATVTVSYSTLPANFALSSISNTFVISNAVNSSENKTMTVNFNSGYCSNGEQNASKLGLDVDYEVKNGLGEDEDWYPLDEIEVTVNVENNGNDDLEDLVLEWCLYDESDKKCVLEDEADTFDLDEDEDTDVVFSFDVDPDELTSGNNDYTLFIKVRGDSSDYREVNLCNEDTVDNINVVEEKDLVILNNIVVPEGASCGQIIDIIGKAWNIGTKDQEDTYFTIYNKEMGLNQRVELGDIDSYEGKTFTASIALNRTLKEKTYNLLIEVFDEDSDLFEGDDVDSKQTLVLKVENCQPASIPASIAAELSSETPRAVIGSQVIVEATIKNTGATSATYTISIEGNNAWSTLAQVDPQTLTLAAGESKKVSIYLNVNKDASATTQEFTIKATQGTASYSQKVQLALEKGFSFSGLSNHFKNNWLIYVIVLINLVLIIAIILVVRSILRKSK